MRQVTWLVIALVVALPEAAGADGFKELDLIRPGRAVAATDFIVPGLTGQPLRLSDFKGKVVFVNFWATWCPPCKQEMPSMERLYRRYRDKGFTILAVSVDSGNVAKVAAFVKRLGLTFPVGLDSDMAIANQYTVRALPSTFLVDRRGTLAALAMGPRDFDSPAARAVVEALLK